MECRDGVRGPTRSFRMRPRVRGSTSTRAEESPAASSKCVAAEDLNISWREDADGSETAEGAASIYLPYGSALSPVERTDGWASFHAVSDEGQTTAQIDVARISKHSSWVVNSVVTCTH